MNLSELISGSIGTQAIDGISNQLGIEKDKTQWVVSAAVPLMMSSLKYNAGKNPKANADIQALADHHEGSIFDNLGSLFGSTRSQEDSQIVDRIFGKNTDQVKNSLAEKAGLSTSNISGILALLGPIVLGFIGKHRKGTPDGGLTDVLGGIVKETGSSTTTSEGFGAVLGQILGGDKTEQKVPSSDHLGDLASKFFGQQSDNSVKGEVLENLVSMFSKK